MPAMNAVFFAMLQWCGIGFVLLAVGSLLCWRCRRSIERLRCIQMTFIALAVACLLQVLPVLPRWNLGWLATDSAEADQRLATSAALDRLPNHDLGLGDEQRFDRQSKLRGLGADSSIGTPDSPAPPTITVTGATIPARPVAMNADSMNVDSWSQHHSASAAAWVNWITAVVLVVFVAGAAAGVFSFGRGVLRLRRLLHDSRPAAVGIVQIFETIARGRRRQVDIRVSPDVAVPITFGLLHPVIVLPDKLARGEAASTLRYCLAHEWSHILNHDVAQWWAVQCLQPLVWFQPLYWLLRAKCGFARINWPTALPPKW